MLVAWKVGKKVESWEQRLVENLVVRKVGQTVGYLAYRLVETRAEWLERQ